MAQPVELPDEKDLFKQIMLTSETVWKNNELNRCVIEDWLSNFNGEVFTVAEERKIALWLLANFVYYNVDEVKRLCKLLYADYIHTQLNNLIIHSTNTWDDIVKIVNASRFYCLGKPGESSAYILYYFRQENKLPTTHFLSTPNNIPSDIEYIVFVEDVLLSGEQAELYIRKLIKEYRLSQKLVILSFDNRYELE